MMKAQLAKFFRRYIGKRICENVNNTAFPRNCLILYVVEPFLTSAISINHQNQWQALELARITGEFGYNVDVASFDSNAALTKKYDLVIDVHPGINDHYKAHMAEACIKIAYITGSNPTVANSAEKSRLTDLFLRRGVRVKPRRQARPFPPEIENFDAFFFIGNNHNLLTYKEFKLPPVFFIRNTGISHFPDLDPGRRSPTDFLFLGSGGQVHKGLDLLLEVFAGHPNLNLFVCSSFKRELDFCKSYRTELFHSKNIHPVGFVATDSAKFREICQRCSYVVLPSCAEANAGSVLTAMAAGLIPIVSRECGFSEDEVHYLDDCSIKTITSTLERFSRHDLTWIGEESRRVQHIAAQNYGLEKYSESVRVALSVVLNSHNNQNR